MNLIANLKGRLGGLIHPDTKKEEPLSYEQLLRSGACNGHAPTCRTAKPSS